MIWCVLNCNQIFVLCAVVIPRRDFSKKRHLLISSDDIFTTKPDWPQQQETWKFFFFFRPFYTFFPSKSREKFFSLSKLHSRLAVGFPRGDNCFSLDDCWLRFDEKKGTQPNKLKSNDFSHYDDFFRVWNVLIIFIFLPFLSFYFGKHLPRQSGPGL